MIEANGLLNAISYLIPRYTNCTVSYVDGGSVTADVAGGFDIDFQSGVVNNSSERMIIMLYIIWSSKRTAYVPEDLEEDVYSGALADAWEESVFLEESQRAEYKCWRSA